MSDAHMRILRLVARQRRADLDEHDAADHPGHAAASRRRLLDLAAAKTGAQVAQAQARRRLLPSRHPNV
jgi:hypothetical protein